MERRKDSECGLMKICSGSKYSLFLSASGKAFGFGNISSNFKTGLKESVVKPKLIPGLQNKCVVDIATLFETSYFITDMGEVYICGNSSGVSGLFKNANYHKNKDNCPKKIMFFHDKNLFATRVFAGDFHVIIRCDNEDIYASRNEVKNEPLGLIKYFTQKRDEFRVISIDCDTSHSYFLGTNGNLYLRRTSISTASSVSKHESIFVLSGYNIRAFSVGFGHGLFITNDTRMCAFGKGDYNAFGFHKQKVSQKPSFFTMEDTKRKKIGKKNVTRIWASASSSLVEINNGMIYAVGKNEYGQLLCCDFTSINKLNAKKKKKKKKKEKKIIRNSPFAIPMKKELLDIGVKDISFGYYHGIVLLKNGSCFYCGPKFHENGILTSGSDFKFIKLEVNLLDVTHLIHLNRNVFIDLYIITF